MSLVPALHLLSTQAQALQAAVTGTDAAFAERNQQVEHTLAAQSQTIAQLQAALLASQRREAEAQLKLRFITRGEPFQLPFASPPVFIPPNREELSSWDCGCGGCSPCYSAKWDYRKSCPTPYFNESRYRWALDNQERQRQEWQRQQDFEAQLRRIQGGQFHATC